MTPKTMNEPVKDAFMQRAAELSHQNVLTGLGGPFGAVIVRDGTIIAQATNAVIGKCDPTAHAEVEAIRKAAQVLGRFDLSDCEIYTSCEPCPMCLGAIYWARLKTIYYANTRADAATIGFDDSFIYDEVSTPIEKRSIPTLHLENQEAKNGFAAWNAFAEKAEY